MELYILSKQDLSILSICKLSDYEINLDEETNAKSIFQVIKTEGLKKGNFLVVNGLYRQFLFLIDDVETEKGSNLSTVTALDISNIFDRKVIEKDTDTMTTLSIEQFMANTMSENFVNSDDTVLNVGYIEITWHTNTQGSVATNAENGLYNFHTFLTNCRQYKNICTDFKFENGKLKIDIENKEDSTELVDTTLPEVTGYNKVYDSDVTAKVTVYIREDGSEYNLYLKTDRTTTENKNDPDRADGKIEVISVDTADTAREEALNVMKGNTYNHLVEFKIAKTSKLMDVTKLYIGRNIRIRTDDDIYDSYISAITIRDENFIYFKSGNLRTTLIDKLKKTSETAGNKLDVSGGKITGNVTVDGKLIPNNGIYINGQKLIDFNTSGKSMAIGKVSEAEDNEKLLEIAMLLRIFSAGNSTTEGGELQLEAPNEGGNYAGSIIDNYQGKTRIFGKASADGTSQTGVGTPLEIDPYSKNLGGGYTIDKAKQDGDGNVITSRYARAGSGDNINLNTVNSGLLYRTGLYSVNDGSTWWNLINLRHRNGEGDGTSYGLQMRNALTSNSKLEVRQHFGGSWQNWRAIPTFESLYENSSGTTGTVTLSQSAANFTYLKIFYRNADSQYSSVEVYFPNGKTTYGTIIRKDSNNACIMLNSVLWAISGTSITPSRNSQANVYWTPSANSDNNAIAIIKVIGYR